MFSNTNLAQCLHGGNTLCTMESHPKSDRPCRSSAALVKIVCGNFPKPVVRKILSLASDFFTSIIIGCNCLNNAAANADRLPYPKQMKTSLWEFLFVCPCKIVKKMFFFCNFSRFCHPTPLPHWSDNFKNTYPMNWNFFFAWLSFKTSVYILDSLTQTIAKNNNANKNGLFEFSAYLIDDFWQGRQSM